MYLLSIVTTLFLTADMTVAPQVPAPKCHCSAESHCGCMDGKECKCEMPKEETK